MTHRLQKRQIGSRQQQATQRRGAVLVAVVACLATFSLIALTMLRGSLVARGQFRSEQHLRQVELLIDAAVARANARIAAGGVAAADDLDETISLPADEIVGSVAGQLVLDGTAEGDGWTLRVVASYPVDGPWAVRRHRDVQLRQRGRTLSAQVDSPTSEENVP